MPKNTSEIGIGLPTAREVERKEKLITSLKIFCSTFDDVKKKVISFLNFVFPQNHEAKNLLEEFKAQKEGNIRLESSALFLCRVKISFGVVSGSTSASEKFSFEADLIYDLSPNQFITRRAERWLSDVKHRGRIVHHK